MNELSLLLFTQNLRNNENSNDRGKNKTCNITTFERVTSRDTVAQLSRDTGGYHIKFNLELHTATLWSEGNIFNEMEWRMIMGRKIFTTTE